MSRLCNGDEQMMLFFSQKCYFTPSCSQRIEIFPFCVFQMSNALWYGKSFLCCYLNLFEYWEYSSTGFKFNARPKPSMLFTNYVNPLEQRISGVIEHVARPLRCKFHAAHVWLKLKTGFLLCRCRPGAVNGDERFFCALSHALLSLNSLFIAPFFEINQASSIFHSR